MDNSDATLIFNRLEDIAAFFSEKSPRNISFRDADNYDYEIYGLFQRWQKAFPKMSFKKEFPGFDIFWEELANWDAQEGWTHERAERIIKLAKDALKEMKEYLKSHK